MYIRQLWQGNCNTEFRKGHSLDKNKNTCLGISLMVLFFPCSNLAVVHMCLGASLVAQWLRICLLVQETRVQSLIREDPMYCEKRNRFRYSRLESVQTDTWNTGSRFTVFLGLGFPGGSDSKESACNAGDPDSIPGSGRNPGEGNGNPFQYSCMENPMDRGTWWATLHGVAKRQTELSD